MWLAIDIGNTHQHWGWFERGELVLAADYSHSYWDERVFERAQEIVVASVVPDRLERWRFYRKVRVLDLDDLSLRGSYETLGVDRALNLLGAGYRYGFPVLVVDFGTAITLTAADPLGQFVGGCIMPGFHMQFQALHSHTARLPEVQLPEQLPPPMAHDTAQAIQSGVVKLTLAGLEQYLIAWRLSQPKGKVIATGGDSALVYRWVPHLFDVHDAQVSLWGIYATAHR
ncbi:type III pantothenate kinase [Anthocerotibacter panamensis]|uniref:type III pantothenate kinase n=1 Tax=Anthocerotibacter panamensis TaxID=2857077 RepID=UPI001C404F43|nr:type III pantothenate kinase [Anthocerotibacter panamensis]